MCDSGTLRQAPGISSESELPMVMRSQLVGPVVKTASRSRMGIRQFDLSAGRDPSDATQEPCLRSAAVKAIAAVNH